MAAPESYPRALQTRVSTSLSRLLQKATQDSKKPQSFRLAQGGALDRPKDTHASRCSDNPNSNNNNNANDRQ